MKQEYCENLDICGFFIKFKGNSEIVKQGWIRLYCEDLEKSEKCVRKQIKRDTGRPPVDNMAPTGDLIPVF
ncbi:MAG: hypothetical protein LAO21_17515 [Acidobacteriia bacterium]|nr:hypothetical protein [Terriglobia bacterium]